jgi:hypothetical protein
VVLVGLDENDRIRGLTPPEIMAHDLVLTEAHFLRSLVRIPTAP